MKTHRHAFQGTWRRKEQIQKQIQQMQQLQKTPFRIREMTQATPARDDEGKSKIKQQELMLQI